MAKIKYKEWKPSDAMLEVVRVANEIIAAEQADGYVLTLRQLYYKFVSRNAIENKESEYKRLGRIITDAREAGMIDWLSIEDRGRNCYFHSYNDSYEKALEGVQYGLGIDPWADQDTYLEVWVEKQALESVVARPSRRRRAPYMACKGYLSASEAWRAGLRFEEAVARGKNPVLLHLGDHDPSGLDMTRDNGVRLDMFSGAGVEVRRLALNWDQVQTFRPPPNPAKVLDSRFANYRRQFGPDSYELDALPNRAIDEIILGAIDSYIDWGRWEASMAREREMRKPLALLGRRWDEVKALVESPEQPLRRLAAMDAAIEEGRLLERGDRLVGRMPEAVDEATLALHHAAKAAVVGASTAAAGPTPQTPTYDDGVAAGLRLAVAKLGAVGFPGLRADDDVLRTQVSDGLADLRAALERFPADTDADTSNDYDPRDPDEDDQREAFGDWAGDERDGGDE